MSWITRAQHGRVCRSVHVLIGLLAAQLATGCAVPLSAADVPTSTKRVVAASRTTVPKPVKSADDAARTDAEVEPGADRGEPRTESKKTDKRKPEVLPPAQPAPQPATATRKPPLTPAPKQWLVEGDQPQTRPGPSPWWATAAGTAMAGAGIALLAGVPSMGEEGQSTAGVFILAGSALAVFGIVNLAETAPAPQVRPEPER